MSTWRRLSPGGWCLVLLTLAGCGRPEAPPPSSPTNQEVGNPAAAGTDSPAPPASTAANLEGRAVEVTGPYVHRNLAVFLIHSAQQDPREFLTLDEGLTGGQVVITEKDQEQVRELLIDNRSDRPLYLQEGERIQGGKQDRTIAASLVVAAHSGRRPLPTFCIEQSRWTEGKGGRQFAFAGSAALAPKGVRGSAKFEKEQGKVWSTVQAQKVSANKALMTANTNSSANEMLDAPQAQAVAKEYAEALAAVLAKHPDAVGVAIAVNGQFEEADVYPNHALLRKLYPRLVQSYAVQAALLKDLGKEAPRLSAGDVAAHLQSGPAKSRREDRLDPRNLLEVRELDNARFVCSTRYEGQVVNWQVMKKTGAVPPVGAAPAAPALGRRAVLGSDW
jgi:hypothetical protein